MKRLILFFLILMMADCYALLSLEGIIFGQADPERQYDPLSGILNKNEKVSITSKKERLYRGRYQQGLSLKNTCGLRQKVRYKTISDEVIAKRSVISVLQYIGLDITLKAIIEYSKKLELTDDQFSKLSVNLVKGSCHPNLSVYGHKLLKNNFQYFWKEGTNFTLPSLKDSSLFADKFSKLQNQKSVIERELDQTIEAFRSFCSWSGDVDNYGLLVPYLNDPFLMSFVFNNLLKQKISFDQKTEELILVDDKDGVQVACKDLMCRRSSEDQFFQSFPTMLGSISLKNDLSRLYCDHFKNQQYKFVSTHPLYKKWITEKNELDPILEKSQFMALITGVPEILFTTEKFSEINDNLKRNIEGQWMQWALRKIDNLEYNILYEESLKIELAETNIDSALRGDFLVEFSLTLGELDMTLNNEDKISSTFMLRFPKKQLVQYKKDSNFFYNEGRTIEYKDVVNKFEVYIKHQLDQKKKYFKTSLWNDDIVPIIQTEITKQLQLYQGQKLSTLDNDFVEIPIRFNYGLFALKYLRDKYLEKDYREKLLTYKK